MKEYLQYVADTGDDEPRIAVGMNKVLYTEVPMTNEEVF